MNNTCEQCRREGDKLMLKGERCLAVKCAMVKRPYAPGSHGQSSGSSNRKTSEYGRQLREKQKAKGIYGLREKQFRGYIGKAEKIQGNTAENLLMLLETRLDNIVYRLKLASSRAHARQMVSHGLVNLNNKKINIPSYLVNEGDIISVKYGDKYSELRDEGVPGWLELDAKSVKGQLKHRPSREEIDTPINESLIIEFYSR